MRGIIFACIFVILPWTAFAAVKEACYPKNAQYKLLKCPDTTHYTLLHSVQSQKVSGGCPNVNAPDPQKWSKHFAQYIWIWCNLKKNGCRPRLDKSYYLIVSYTCVPLKSIHTMDLCSNLTKTTTTPVHLHSPGYHPEDSANSQLFRWNWKTNCTCRLSVLPRITAYDFKLQLHDALTGVAPDGHDLRWGQGHSNFVEDISEYGRVELKQITKDVFIYFVPSQKQSGWFWMNVETKPIVNMSIACNAHLNTSPTTEPYTSTTSTTTTTTETTTTTTTEPTTTTTTEPTTTTTTETTTTTAEPTTTTTAAGDPNMLKQRERAADGTPAVHDNMKDILIATSTVPWAIILIIVVVALVFIGRRMRPKQATATNEAPIAMDAGRVGRPPQAVIPPHLAADSNIYAEPSYDIDPPSYDQSGDLSFSNPVYTNLKLGNA